jgi:hypothetical protein
MNCASAPLPDMSGKVQCDSLWRILISDGCVDECI